MQKNKDNIIVNKFIR